MQACIRFPLGKQGENEAVRVVWPGIVEKFRKLYGSGAFTLTAKRCGDAAAYPVAVSTEGGDVVWLVRAADVANPGSGSCELTYTVDGVVAKSQTWSTYVAASISGDAPGEPPGEPAKAWFAAIQAQIGNLDDLTTKARASLVAAINEAAKTGSGGAGSISMRTADGYIQYSTDDGANWANLIALAELKGAPGQDGAPGKDGEPGKDGHTPKIAATKTGKTTSITADGLEIAQIKDGEDAAADPSLGITGAQAGQIAKITAVDDTGKPTEWSPVDMPSGDSLGAVLYTRQGLTDKQKQQARDNIEALSNNSVYYTYLPNNHSNDIYKLALSGPIGFITGRGAAGMIPPITVIFGAIDRGIVNTFAIDFHGYMYHTGLSLASTSEPVWTKIEQLRLNNNGTLPQQTMASSPTESMQIATKKYVDDHATGGGGETWETINVITLSNTINTMTINQDSNGNAIALKKVRILVEGSATENQDLFLNNSRYIRASVVGTAASVGALSAEPFCGKMYCFAVPNIIANYDAKNQITNIFSKEITITEIKLIVNHSGTFSAGTKFTIQGVRA